MTRALLSRYFSCKHASRTHGPAPLTTVDKHFNLRWEPGVAWTRRGFQRRAASGARVCFEHRNVSRGMSLVASVLVSLDVRE